MTARVVKNSRVGVARDQEGSEPEWSNERRIPFTPEWCLVF